MHPKRPERYWQIETYHAWRNTRRFSPPTDVIEMADKIVIQVEIAGMRAADLNIVLLDHQLVIAGKRERTMLDNPAYHQVEIGYGEFRVEVDLRWAIDQTNVSAIYRDGFLQIELPRRPETNIRVVDVATDDPTHQD